MKLATKLGYGVGQAADGIKTSAFSTFLFFYYNQVLGLSGSLAGTVALLALIVDAITDPMVGQYSDRCQSRWGRRHPFMLVGAIPFALAMIALFSPPDGLGQTGLFVWMLVGSVSVRLMLTLFFVPHLSLGAEMVTDYHQRTSLIGYRVFFSYAGVLATSVIGFAVFFPASEAFSNGMLNPDSYSGFGAFVGIMGCAAMLIAVASTWKLIPQLAKPRFDPEAKSALLAFITVFLTLKQRAFRILFSTTLMFMILAGVTQTLLIYVATYIFEFQPDEMALIASSVVIGIVVAPWLSQWVSLSLDKKRALAVCVVGGALLSTFPFLLYFLGGLQLMSSGEKMLLVFISNGLAQAFFIAYVILLDSMLSDTIDEHELHTARREEGLFFAARSLATKASYGLGTFFAGIALDLIKFPQGASPETVSQSAIDNLAILAGPVSVLLFVMTLLISSRYPLDASRHREIREHISERKQAASAMPGAAPDRV
ncbi:MFS transporter [Spongiibacter sp.]|uniref:MFS transporter n=1 Tax=Spongiibacter sp. TaxID=2024860 RepID=UPI003565EB66